MARLRPELPSSWRVLGMPVARFLRDYWQKKPLLVRGAFPEFRDPISPDELAGLSCEEGVESRIVREKGGAHPWEVTWGPHPEERFAELPERGWTILVQELNRHLPEAALLLEPFSFIPNVRVDDVMVSYAAPGGSVGAHLDSYDVFLVQGMGERRWQYHEKPTKDVRLVPDLDLRILARFVPEADEVLSAGDMLYLPPGFAHYGVAVTECLTYSVGFRAPSAGEMWKDFAARAASVPDAAKLLVDPALAAGKSPGEMWKDFAARAASVPGATKLLVDPALGAGKPPGEIPKAMLERVRETIRSMDTSNEAIDRWFASFATRLGPGRELTPPARPLGEAKIASRLERGDVVVRSEEGRWAYLPASRGALRLYVGGLELDVPSGATDLARLLASARRFDGAELGRLARSRAARTFIVRLFDLGALRFGPRASGR